MESSTLPIYWALKTFPMEVGDKRDNLKQNISGLKVKKVFCIAMLIFSYVCGNTRTRYKILIYAVKIVVTQS